jgi:hypothetical protein
MKEAREISHCEWRATGARDLDLESPGRKILGREGTETRFTGLGDSEDGGSLLIARSLVGRPS